MKNRTSLFMGIKNGRFINDLYGLEEKKLFDVFESKFEKTTTVEKEIINVYNENAEKMIEKFKNKESIQIINDQKSKTSTYINSEVWESNDLDRLYEQQMSMIKTNVYSNLQFNEMFVKHMNEFRLNRAEKGKESQYEQFFLEEGFTFSHWLTIVFAKDIGIIYKYYSKVMDLLNSGKIEKIGDNLESYGRLELTGSNYIIYDVEKECLAVNYEGNCVYFIFNKKELRTQKLRVPGFNILYKRFCNSKFNTDKPTKHRNYNQIDSTNDIVKTTTIEDLIYNISEHLGVKPHEYLEVLLKSKNNVFSTEEHGLFISNGFSDKPGFSRKTISYEWFENNRPNMTQTINNSTFFNNELVPWELIFLADLPNLEKNLMQHRNKSLGTYLIELYIKLNKYNQPVKLVVGQGEVGEIKIVENRSNTDRIHINNYGCAENVFYGWESRSKSESKEEFNIIVKSNPKDVLEENKYKFYYYIKKLKEGKLENKEIKWMSSFFYYTNKNVFQKTNLRIRTLIEIINKKRGKYLNFLDVLKARYGGSSSIIMSLFMFTYHVKVSPTGQKILEDSNLWYIKDECWVSVGKNISELVKTENFYKGGLITFDDFKNLQYIDTWIGPMGNDGKNGSEILEQRTYTQNPKTFLNLSRPSIDNVVLADIICKKVFTQYWEKVITESVEKNVEFKGIYNTLNERDVYSTDSSAGGLLGQFDNKKIEQTAQIKAKRSNKKTVFESEDTWFFMNVIFDLPKTMCDMILKQKEMAKLRYIYSVTMDHYLVSSIVLYHLEPFLNKMGVKVRQDEKEVVTHNKNVDHLFFNCIDYSEFNDQHEEKHKKMVFSCLSNVIKEKQLYGTKQEEYLLMVEWLEISCGNMLIRVESDNSTFYRHKGRLFSGERATTLINSMMSVFYFTLIISSVIEYDYYSSQKGNPKIFKNVDELKKEVDELLKDGKLENSVGITNLINNTVCLGDDGKTVFDSILPCIVFNEMAIMCGLMLKLNKCMIGIGMSEFLRKIEVKSLDVEKITISKGYVNRGISALVNGNPEGSDQKDYIGWITQIYEMLNTIMVRSEYSKMLTEIFEECWHFISKLNQKNKEFSNMPLPNYILYVPKKLNGLGFISFENTYCTVKVPIPKILNAVTFKKDKWIPDIPTPSIQARVEIYSLGRVKKYGDINKKNLASRLVQEKKNYINANDNNSVLYNENFIKQFSKNREAYYKAKKRIVVEQFHKELFLKSDIINEGRNFVYNVLSGQIGENQLTTSVERAEAFNRDLDLVKTVLTKKEILENEFGKYVYNMLLFKEQIEEKVCCVEYVEPSAYNKTFSVFLGERELTKDNVFYYKTLFELTLKEVSTF